MLFLLLLLLLLYVSLFRYICLCGASFFLGSLSMRIELIRVFVLTHSNWNNLIIYVILLSFLHPLPNTHTKKREANDTIKTIKATSSSSSQQCHTVAVANTRKTLLLPYALFVTQCRNKMSCQCISIIKFSNPTEKVCSMCDDTNMNNNNLFRVFCCCRCCLFVCADVENFKYERMLPRHWQFWPQCNKMYSHVRNIDAKILSSATWTTGIE